MIRDIMRFVRMVFVSWMPVWTLDHLREIRQYEAIQVVGELPHRSLVLEVGAGAGWQARIFADLGRSVTPLEVHGSKYSRISEVYIRYYDGEKIPYSGKLFDAVFTSNTLEHMPRVMAMQSEMQRVLIHMGIAVHVVPTASWAFWTFLTTLFKWWRVPHAHGVHARNPIKEMFSYTRKAWERLLLDAGWLVEKYHVNNIFYTGNSIFAGRLSLKSRVRLSRILGSSCHIFVLRVNHES